MPELNCEGHEGIGRRIAAYRRRRGISQTALAGLVSRSESWLSQVEHGARSVDRLSVLVDLAEILHVDVADLIGRPWRLAPNGGPLIGGLDTVRHTLAAYPYLGVHRGIRGNRWVPLLGMHGRGQPIGAGQLDPCAGTPPGQARRRARSIGGRAHGTNRLRERRGGRCHRGHLPGFH